MSDARSHRNLSPPAFVAGLVAALVAAAVAWPALAQPTRAPPIKLTRLDGAPVAASDLKGKVVVLDLWATWCTPCLAGIPKMADLQARYGKQGFMVLGVSLDDDRAKLDAYLAHHPPGFAVVTPTADFNTAYGRVLKLKDDRIVASDKLINANLPSWVLIDRKGRIVAIHKSSTEELQLIDEADQLMK